jgi:hypothetical protein
MVIRHLFITNLLITPDCKFKQYRGHFLGVDPSADSVGAGANIWRRAVSHRYKTQWKRVVAEISKSNNVQQLLAALPELSDHCAHLRFYPIENGIPREIQQQLQYWVQLSADRPRLSKDQIYGVAEIGGLHCHWTGDEVAFVSYSSVQLYRIMLGYHWKSKQTASLECHSIGADHFMGRIAYLNCFRTCCC